MVMGEFAPPPKAANGIGVHAEPMNRGVRRTIVVAFDINGHSINATAGHDMSEEHPLDIHHTGVMTGCPVNWTVNVLPATDDTIH